MIKRAAGVNSEQMEDENGDREDDEDGDDSDYECEEADLEGDHTYDTEAETDETTEIETEEEDFNEKPDLLTIAGKSLRSEPKHIVFLSQLLVLFNFCHICKADNPSVEARQIGTKAMVTSTCCNPKCPKPVNHWHSQPNMPDSGIAAGNFLLCMAILLAGGSASKVFQIFAHMGLGCVSLNTFFKCQRVSYCVQYSCIKYGIIVY
ncbi:PREDICTED: uncharacterized protein LOC107330266 [Acropora digitifera]|uniref:uncharacterized protein LOC107330266 n=1 Tax=Acropora digitifera TaxID=70779 RepID=UPI00077A0C38|nr:PREDICTED: uncharacterized protein LOC107330266 [Acropora digitifera]